MGRWKQWGINLVFGAMGITYALVVIRSAGSQDTPLLNIAAATLPLIALAVYLIWGLRYRNLLLLGLTIAAGASWYLWGELMLHNYTWFYLLQHAGINVALAILFGRTLRKGRTALVTRFAAIVHRELDPLHLRYTRQVTLAWTLFFASMALGSCLLFVLAPFQLWAMFSNIVSPLLMALMFIGEYLFRLRRLPHVEHINFIDTIRIATRYYREGHHRAGS